MKNGRSGEFAPLHSLARINPWESSTVGVASPLPFYPFTGLATGVFSGLRPGRSGRRLGPTKRGAGGVGEGSALLCELLRCALLAWKGSGAHRDAPGRPGLSRERRRA